MFYQDSVLFDFSAGEDVHNDSCEHDDVGEENVYRDGSVSEGVRGESCCHFPFDNTCWPSVGLGIASESRAMSTKNRTLTKSPVIMRLQSIVDDILSIKDPELYNFLSLLGIEPQVYALKWLRLLFFREFHMQDVVVLWDFLFASEDFQKSVDYIAVAMLVFIRSQVMVDDFGAAIKRLFRFPPVESIRNIVESSVALQQDGFTAAKLFPEKFVLDPSKPKRKRRWKSKIKIWKRGRKEPETNELQGLLERIQTVRREVSEMKYHQLYLGQTLMRHIFKMELGLLANESQENGVSNSNTGEKRTGDVVPSQREWEIDVAKLRQASLVLGNEISQRELFGQSSREGLWNLMKW